jgi:hypothetical protein
VLKAHLDFLMIRIQSVTMTTHRIGRIVIGCLAGGPVVALALVLGPVAGAQEHVITGTVLLAFAASWAFLAMLSTVWTAQPQRWAAAIARFMAFGARVGLAVALPRASRWNGDPRSPGSSQSQPNMGRVPAVSSVRALRLRRLLSDHPRIDRPRRVSGVGPVG